MFGLEIDLFVEVCKEFKVYGVFLIMEKNFDGGELYNIVVIIDL